MADKQEDKALELKRLFNAIDPDRLQKTDFIEAFEGIVAAISKLKKQLTDTAENLTAAVQEARTNLSNDATLTKSNLTAAVQKAIAAIKNGLDGRDGRDGIDGISPTIQEVAEAAANLIKLPEYRAPIMDGPEEIAIKLDLLDDDNQLAAIKKLREEIAELKARPINLGAAMTPIHRSLSNQSFPETPDGIITEYHLLKAPKYVGAEKIYINRTRMVPVEDYTVANRTVTFSVAPITGDIIRYDLEF